MESKAGQVVKDLVKIGGGLMEMRDGLITYLINPELGGKLLEEGKKNFTEGINSTTGKYVLSTIQTIGGAIEFGIGAAMAVGAGWTGVGLVAGAALMAYGANNMIEGGTSIYNMATGKGEKGINLIRDSVFTPVFGDKWGSILYSVTDIGVGFMGPGLMAQAKNLPKLGGVLSGAKGLMTNIPEMVNGAKAGLTNFVEGVKNFPIIPETVINVGDRFVSTKGKTAGDLFNFIVGKGDDAGDVVKGTSKTTGAYNPNLSMDIGNGLGKLNGKSINVSEKGLNLVKKHISQFGDIPENQAMINRIESALKNGQPITGADASFYMHEVAEATMMQKGIPYEVAHEAVLQKYNVSPYSVYHPEVIQQFSEWFNQGFKDFWGLK